MKINNYIFEDNFINNISSSTDPKKEETSLNDTLPPEVLRQILSYLNESDSKNLRLVDCTWNAMLMSLAASKEGTAIAQFINFLGEHSQNIEVKEKLLALESNRAVFASQTMEELKASGDEIRQQTLEILAKLSKEELLHLHAHIKTTGVPKPFCENMCLDIYIKQELDYSAPTLIRKLSCAPTLGYEMLIREFMFKEEWDNAARVVEVRYGNSTLIKDGELLRILENAETNSHKPFDKKVAKTLMAITSKMTDPSLRDEALRRLSLRIAQYGEFENRKAAALSLVDKIAKEPLKAEIRPLIENYPEEGV